MALMATFLWYSGPIVSGMLMGLAGTIAYLLGNKFVVIGLTGGIASGKSSVSRILKN